jgi:hypothetical protein
MRGRKQKLDRYPSPSGGRGKKLNLKNKFNLEISTRGRILQKKRGE